MKTTLTWIRGAIAIQFPKHTDALWMPEHLINSFIPDFKDQPSYVKISCTEPLKEFTVYAKVEIQSSSLLVETKMYIDPSNLPKNELIDEKVIVIIEPINLEELPEAQSVNLKLSEDLVMTWSEEESEFAKKQYKTKNRLVYFSQNILLQSGSQKSALANIVKIHPATERNQALRITENTVVNLEGFPENQQKVINFDKIGGLDTLIQSIREIIQVPLVYPHLLDSFKIQPPKGLLLYGPPGNGKTMIAKAIAHSLGAKFVSIEGPELNSKYVGVAEQRLREKFEEASQYKNSVLFIDEIDAIARNRDHENSESHQIDTVATLLNLMDGIRSAKGLFVIGATNRLDTVDSALRRPGRFELEYEIGLPDQVARLDILKKNIPLDDTSLIDNAIDDAFLNYLSEVTNGYSGADIVSLYRLSVIRAIRRSINIQSDTGRIELDENSNPVHLQVIDIQETLKEITPTSLRGIYTKRQNIRWSELIISDNLRLKMQTLHHWMEKVSQSDFTQRMSFMNVLIKGDEGSGKKTLLEAFAKEYRYELICFDLLEELSRPFAEVILRFEQKLQRCKQVAPSVFYIENATHYPEFELLFITIKKSLDQIGNRQPVLAVLAISKDHYLLTELGKYSDFEFKLELPNARKEDLKLLAQKYKIDMEHLEKWKDLPVGNVIRKIEEHLIQSS